MGESNKMTHLPHIPHDGHCKPPVMRKIEFVAEVTIQGDYTIKQLVPFRDKLYVLIERPDTTPELYYVNEETKKTDLVKFEGLEPK